MDLSHARLKILPPIIARLSKVKALTLRQNLLKDITSLLKLKTLKELDLYDNEISEIPDFSELNTLE